MNKPTVTFKYPAFVVLDDRAEIEGVKDHPLLGSVPQVSTSRVISIDYDEPTGSIKGFETLNTKYVLEDAAACECKGCGCN